MEHKIKIPNLGESISEAVISKWFKNTGDKVKKDEVLLELETEKINLEVNSPSTGIVKTILKQEQESVGVGEVVGEVAETVQITTSEELKEDSKKNILSTNSIRRKDENIVKSDVDSQLLSDHAHGPEVQKILFQNNIQPSEIKNPTGRGGRISKVDVLDYLEHATKKNSDLTEESENNNNFSTNEDEIEYVKISPLRKTIARRLKESQNTAAILSTFNEIDMYNLSELRKEYKDEFQKKFSVKLGFMSFFIRASILALKEIPSVNAEIQEKYILYKKYYNIAVAVGTVTGLVVPVIRNADKLSFAELELKIIDLATKAREGKLSMDDMQGGSFSITNGGVYGSLLSTPIINPPQTAILGMHNIQKRPIVVKDEIKIRPMMYIALSYDHRIIDGKDAVGFLVKIKHLLENPERLLLNL